MNIIFMGTPEFAVPSLRKLIEEYNVTAVITQPDKPKGRGKKMSYSAVKEEALKYEIPIFQPTKLRGDKDLIQKLKELNPDFIIVVAYGQILPQEVLDIPTYGCINLHGSILPMYRGSAPIQWAVINGEKVSGNTTMLMDAGLDTGDMILKDEVEITDNMTAGQLYDILMARGADLLVRTIDGIASGSLTPEKQNGETFYAKPLDKNIAKIEWNKSSNEIHNLVRGLNPWPIAYTNYNDDRMKIFETQVLKEETSKEPGTILGVSKNGIKVACKEGVLLIKKIQFPNGKPLTIEQYINGHEININVILK